MLAPSIAGHVISQQKQEVAVIKTKGQARYLY
jgi:hypothetical protein